jgi:hypothetical protein
LSYQLLGFIHEAIPVLAAIAADFEGDGVEVFEATATIDMNRL